MSTKTTADMKWHLEKHVNGGVLWHPADCETWKKFDQIYESFTMDPHSVRFGLTTNEFNPFRNMNIKYNVWPIILFPYNLPPLDVHEGALLIDVITYTRPKRSWEWHWCIIEAVDWWAERIVGRWDVYIWCFYKWELSDESSSVVDYPWLSCICYYFRLEYKGKFGVSLLS